MDPIGFLKRPSRSLEKKTVVFVAWSSRRVRRSKGHFPQRFHRRVTQFLQGISTVWWEVVMSHYPYQPCTYGIFTYICLIFMVYLPTWLLDYYGINVGKYAIHGWYGLASLWRVIAPVIRDYEPVKGTNWSHQRVLQTQTRWLSALTTKMIITWKYLPKQVGIPGHLQTGFMENPGFVFPR